VPKQPAEIFEELDISGFEPKAEPPAKPTPEIKAAAEAQNFQSREPRSKPAKKQDRRRRTGRNIQLSAKISQHAQDLLDEIYETHRDKENWTIGEILEFGFEAFKREIEQGRTV
jgi:hypothetical protein